MLRFLSSMASSSSSIKIVAEYAKSNLSSCKKCTKTIPAAVMRLGLVTRGPRGFDDKKWHHLHCFPLNSNHLSSADVIEGFSQLKGSDQEGLMKLFSEGDQHQEKSGQDEENELQERNPEKEKDANLLPKWKAFQTIIFLERDDGLQDSRKIAAFDFDGYLAKTSLRRVGADAWSLMYPSIPEKLQSLYNDGFKLFRAYSESYMNLLRVIFTNESNIDRWKNKGQAAVDSKLGRLDGFIKRVKVPIQAIGLKLYVPEEYFTV